MLSSSSSGYQYQCCTNAKNKKYRLEMISGTHPVIPHWYFRTNVHCITPVLFWCCSITGCGCKFPVEILVAGSVYCRTGHTTVGPYYLSFLRKYLRILYECSRTVQYNLLLSQCLQSSYLLCLRTYCASY